MSLEELLAAYDGDDGELRLMIEQRSQLADLMGSPGWQVFRDAVYSRLAGVQKRMMLGRYPDGFEAYQRDVGFVLGMTEAADKTLSRVEAMIEARLRADPDRGDEYPDDFTPAE